MEKQSEKNIHEKVLNELDGEFSSDSGSLAVADGVLQGLTENLIRGWGLNQFEDDNATVGLVICLLYARASLQSDCCITEGIVKVKSQIRNFCKECQDRQ